MASTITAKSTVAEIRTALAAAGIEAPSNARKMALLDLLHPATALDVQAPEGEQVEAAADEPAAAPAKRQRASKNKTVEVSGYRVALAAWVTVHDAEGRRMAVLRRSALPALGVSKQGKKMRTMTEVLAGEVVVGWVRNDTTVVKMGRIIAKAAK